MNTRSINISTLVIFFSITCVLFEGLLYYFLPNPLIVVAFSWLINISISHYLLEKSFEYFYLMLFTIFTMVGMSLITLIIIAIQPNKWVHFDISLILIIISHWLVVFLYGTFQDLKDPGPRFRGYAIYLRQNGLVLLLFYIVALVITFYIVPVEPVFPKKKFGLYNFVPLMSTYQYIIYCIEKGKSVIPIIISSLEIIALFIPAGFLFRLYTPKMFFGNRFVFYVLMPLFMELSQYITSISRAEIDEYTLDLIGMCIGVLCYHVLNGIYLSTWDREIGSDRTKINVRQFDNL